METSALFKALITLPKIAIEESYPFFASEVVKIVSELTGNSDVALWDVNLDKPERRNLTVFRKYGSFKEEVLKDVKIPIDTQKETITTRALNKKMVIRVTDILKENSSLPDFYNKEVAIIHKWRSLMTIPLISKNGEILGALNLYNTSKGYFTDELEERIQIIANQIAIARQHYLRSDLFKGLAEIGETLIQEAPKTNIDALHKVAKKITNLVQADLVNFSLTNEFKELFSLDRLGMAESKVLATALFGWFDSKDLVSELEQHEHIAVEDLNKGTYKIKSDEALGDRLRQAIAECPYIQSEQLKAFILIPLQFLTSGGKEYVKGLLCIGYRKPMEFKEEEINIFKIASNQVAKFLFNSSQARYFEGLREKLLMLEENEELVFDQIVEIAIELLEADGGVLYLRKEGTRRIEAKAVKGIKVEAGNMMKKSFSMAYGEGMAGHLMDTDAPYIIEPDFLSSKYCTNRFSSANFKHVLEVPLILDGEKYGVLAVVTVNRPFRVDQVEPMQQLAKWATLALSQNRRIHDLNDIRTFTQKINIALSNQYFYEEIVEEIGIRLRCDVCKLYIRDRTNSFASPRVYRKKSHLNGLKDPIDLKLPFKEVLDKKESWNNFLSSEEEKYNEGLILTPIVIQNRVIAIIEVLFPFKVGLSKGMVRYVETLAEQTGTVIQTAKGLQLVEETSKAIVSSDNVKDMLTRIGKALNIWNFSVFIDFHLTSWAKETNAGSIVRYPKDDNYPTSRFNNKEGSLVRALLNKQDLILIPSIKNYEGPLELNPKITNYKNYKSLIGLRLALGEEAIGAMFINSKESYEPSKVEISFLKHVADQVAIGLNRAMLSRRIQKQRDTVIKAVSHVGELVSSVINKDRYKQLLQHMLDSILHLVGEHALGEIRFHDKQKNALVVHALQSRHHKTKEEYRSMPINTGIVGKCFKENKEFLMLDVSKVPNYVNCYENTRSEVVAPIRKRGNVVIGVLNIEHPDKDGLNEQDLEITKAFAELIGITQEYSELFKNNIEAVRNLSNSVSPENSIEDILEHVASWTEKLLVHPSLVSIWLVDENNPDVLYKKVGRGIIKTNEGKRKIKIGEGIIGKAFHLMGTIHVKDIRKDKDYIAVAKDTLSELALPLISDRQCFGVLNIESKRLEAFDLFDIEIAKAIADLAGIAIANNQIYTSHIEAIKRIGASLRGPDLWNAIRDRSNLPLEGEISKLIESSEFDSILQSLINWVKSLFRWTRTINLWIVNDQEQCLELKYHRGITPEEKVLDLRLGVIGKVAKTGESVLVSDVNKGTENYYEGVEFTASELAVPLKIGDTVIAVLNLEHRKQDAFSVYHQSLLEAIVEVASVAFQNTYLSNLLQNRETQLEEELKVAYERKDFLLRTLGHSFKKRLMDLMIFERFGKYVPLPETLLDPYHAAIYSIRDMRDIVDNLLVYDPIKDGKLIHPKKGTDIYKIIKNEIESCRNTSAKFKNIEIWHSSSSNGSFAGYFDSMAIRRIISNLLNNAIKFSPQNGEVRVNCLRDDSKISFSVANDGPAIAKKDQEKIFEMGYQASTKEGVSNKDGNGLGLAIVKKFVEEHGGEIKVESREMDKKGVKFIVSLPVQNF